MQQSKINEWILLYEGYKSSAYIGKIYGVSCPTILKYLRINNVKIRDTTPLNLPHKKKFNINYFEKIDSEEKSYFLGLLYSDGNLSKNTITLSLQKKDKHILDHFLKSLEGNMNIYEYNNECVLKFTDKKIASDLNKLGIFPKKSLLIKYPYIPKKLENHFMRGFFDGDGCISIHRDSRDNSDRGQVNICCGSSEFINKYVDNMVKYCEVKKNSIRCPNGNYYVIDWGGLSDVEKIYKFLYKNSTIFLKRKKEKFDKVIYIHSNKKKYRKS